MRKFIAIVAWLCAMLAAPSGWAAPMTMQFTASGIIPSAQNVSGVVKWEAASPKSPIDSFTSINLTIAGHAYSLGEISFFVFGDPNHVAIGVPNVADVTGGTNDFILTWFLSSLSADFFSYGTSGPPGSGTFFATSISFQVTADTAADVPAPASGALLGLALGALALVRRRCRAL